LYIYKKKKRKEQKAIIVDNEHECTFKQEFTT